MIQKILDFRDITAEECMTPLINLTAIDESSSADYAIQKARESSFSRLPVFKERIYNITGIIHTFDLLSLPEDENSIKNIIRPAFYVPASKRVDDLFQQMQDKGDHMAVVVDEYGAAIGIITIEDMLEEIVGEIEDEFDKIPSLYVKKGKDYYEIKGEMEIDMINEELEIQLPLGDYETLAGLVTFKMGKIPKAEEILNLEEHQIIVKEVDPRKVILLEVKKRN
jgi:CBS domain containing-hemolysin-like protein